MASLMLPSSMKYYNFLFDFIFRLGLLLTGGARGPGVRFLLWLFINDKEGDLFETQYDNYANDTVVQDDCGR